MSQPETTRWSKLLPRLARYLPANLFNQLRTYPENLDQLQDEAAAAAARTLLTVNRTLEPLHRVLVQYMPRYLNELDPTPGQPHGKLLEGSFIFADVTGFTALTELLARQGQGKGPELMNQIMNRLFTEILDPLIASGGDLLIFAGDAALVYFPKQDNDNDIFQAVRAALRMERAIIPFASFETEFGRCSLTMSAGVERGLAYAGVVGTQRRMELLVSGPGIDEAMEAETQAEPGQVMLGARAQRVAQDHFNLKGALVIDDLGDRLGDYEISLPTRKRGGSVFIGMEIGEILTTVETALQRVERLSPFLPEDMLAHLVNTDRHRQLVSEFRPVAVQFIHIVGLEALAVMHGSDMATAVFQRYFVRAEEIINQHEGVISQVDAYAGGFFLLNTFGTPKAHEGATRYAVSAALQLAKILEQINQEFKLESPLKQRGGITYGLVFNGEVGAKYRRESVIVGPAVNRAARLMSKAQFGQVILDAEIWEETRTAFVGEQLPPVKLKGIPGQVVIVNVHEIRRGTRLQPLERPLLGREAEQLRLAEAREGLVRRHQGGAWLVHGETGLGKTSLISDFAQKARQYPLTILVGRCQPHGKNIPLFVWTDLLIGWLDVDESANPAKERARLAAELASLEMLDAETALADLLGLGENGSREKRASLAQPAKEASLLGALGQRIKEERVANAASQPGGLTALLDSRVNQSQKSPATTLWKRLEDRTTGPGMMIRLLQQLAKAQPLLIILEDIHWIDRESDILLDKLIARAAELPILLILTGRKRLAKANIEMIKLAGLPASALTQVAQRAFGAQALDGSLAEWVCQQAHGNPLYAEELCQALRQTDAIFLDRETGEVRWTKQAPALPLSLHELLLTRLDELPLAEQDVLKRAAVIGISFDDESLLHLSKDRTAPHELKLALEQAVQGGFVVEMQDKSYRFNHPLMQEAIYATLSYSQRQRWHTEIGRWLSQRQPEPPVELLAYHYLRGNDVEKAADFALRAGQRAQLQGAYTGALIYYEQVLELPDSVAPMRMAAAEYQGDVLMVLNDYSAARQAYEQASQLGSAGAAGKLAILAGDLEVLARTQFADALRPWAEASRAWLLAQNDQFEQALSSIQTAIRLDGSQEAIKILHTSLKNRRRPGPYEEWLQQFARAAVTTYLINYS